MKTNDKLPRQILQFGIPISIVIGVIGWMTSSLSTGLMIAGAGMVACALLSFFLNSKSASGKSDVQKKLASIQLVDKAPLEAVRKQAKKTNPKSMKKEMRDLDSQCDRMITKAGLLDAALKKEFDGSLITQTKYAGTINGVMNLFAQNVEDVLKRINLFDQQGYEQLFRNHQEYSDAAKPYQEQIQAVQKEIQENEDILSRIDRLLSEISRLSEENGDLQSLPEMEELSTLIAQTDLYKQNGAL